MAGKFEDAPSHQEYLDAKAAHATEVANSGGSSAASRATALTVAEKIQKCCDEQGIPFPPD